MSSDARMDQGSDYAGFYRSQVELLQEEESQQFVETLITDFTKYDIPFHNNQAILTSSSQESYIRTSEDSPPHLPTTIHLLQSFVVSARTRRGPEKPQAAPYQRQHLLLSSTDSPHLPILLSLPILPSRAILVQPSTRSKRPSTPLLRKLLSELSRTPTCLRLATSTPHHLLHPQSHTPLLSL